ncbi:MAG: hypothetical protein ABI882_13290, partial [Acidobacteriota bacterium]
MEPNFTDSEIHEHAALYALGALGQNEAHALEAMLEEEYSSGLRGSVDSFSEVVALMGFGALPAE